MAKMMTKAKVIDHLAKNAGVTKKVVTSILDDFTSLAYKQAKNSFTIPGIGKLVVGKRKARNCRNPQTGATIRIPAKKVVKFRVSKSCKDAVVG